MSKILIAFASMSGNTEEIAELIKTSIEPLGHGKEFVNRKRKFTMMNFLFYKLQ